MKLIETFILFVKPLCAHNHCVIYYESFIITFSFFTASQSVLSDFMGGGGSDYNQQQVPINAVQSAPNYVYIQSTGSSETNGICPVPGKDLFKKIIKDVLCLVKTMYPQYTTLIYFIIESLINNSQFFDLNL